MRLASKFITVLLALVMIATAAGVGYVLFSMLSAEDPNAGENYEIYLPSKAELYSDRPYRLCPEFFDASGSPVRAKFVYACDSTAVRVADDGTVTVLDPDFTGEVTVLVTESVTGAQKSITLRIVSELTYVNEVQADGASITAVREMKIGDTYRFDLITVPASVATADYFDFFVTDGNGARAEVFDCRIEGNSVHMTACGLGSGTLHFVMQNEERGLYFEQEVDFSVSTPDPTFGESILATAEDSLISKDELSLVRRAVFPQEVTEVGFASSAYFPNLYSLVFLSEEPVSVTDLPDGTVVRVNGEDLYNRYIEDGTWGAYAARIYPYLAGDHTRPVAVYHNADAARNTLIQNQLIANQNGYGIEHITYYFYDYISATSPEQSFGYAEDGTPLPQYTLDGYRFVGWRTAEGEEVGELSEIEEGIHLYAAWEALEYTLTLEDYNAGEATYTVTYREAIGELPKPSKPGWRFVGWYLSEEYASEDSASANDERTAYCLARDITLYAKYVTDVTLDYRTEVEGLPTVLNSIVYGKPLETLPVLEDCGGWTAGGWYTSEGYRASEVVLSSDAFTYENAEGITLYAKYTYNLRVDVLSSSLTASVFEDIRIYCGLTLGQSLAVEGRELPVCVNADEEKWRFYGWTSTPYENGFQNGALNPSLAVGADKILTPETKVIYPVFRAFTFLATGLNGENLLGTHPIVYGCYIGEIETAIPKIDGFEANGWYNSARHKLSATDIAFYDDGGATYAVWYNAIEYCITARNSQDALERESVIPFWAIGVSDTDHVLNNDTGSGLTGRNVVLPVVPDLLGFTEYWTFDRHDEIVSVVGPDQLTAVGYPWTVDEDVFRNITLNHYYSPNTYTYTFDVFGAPVEYEKTLDIVYTSTTPLPVPEAPEGYTFDGWFLDRGLAEKDRYDTSSGHRIPHDVTLYAKFVKTVEFVGYGNTFAYQLVYAADYTDGTSFFGAPSDYSPETSAWRFVGWEDAVGNLITDGISDYRRTDTVYTAVFVRDIRLSLPDGFALSDGTHSITVRRGLTLREQNIVLPSDADVIKTGIAEEWTLLGWYFFHPLMEGADHDVSSSDPVNIMDGAVDVLYADLYTPITLKIPYPSLGTVEEAFAYIRLGFPLFSVMDEKATALFEAEYGRGYYHIGWKIGEVEWDKTADAEGYAAYAATLTHTLGETFTALFRPNPYTVNYDPNGGSDVPSVGMTFGDEITLADAPTRLGYFFLGWEDPSTGDLYAAGEVLRNLVTSGSITLTAKWRALEYNVSYEAPDADEAVPMYHATYGTAFPLPTPTREHYVFKGWKFGDTVYAAGEEVENLTATEGETVTLTALWEPRQYKITFRDAEGHAHCVRIFTVEKRSIQTPMDPPEKLGYLATWEDYSEKLATLSENFEVQAVYTPITYTLVYEGTDPQIEQALTYDASATVSMQIPIRIGYRFIGWSINSELYKSGDAILNLSAENGATVLAKPIYKIVVYSAVFYDENENEIGRDTYTVEEPEITPPAVPEKVGYTAKWEDYEPVYAGEGIRVYPFYDLITYTVEFYADGNFIASDTYTVEDMSITVPDSSAIPARVGYKDGRWPELTLDANAPSDLRVDALYTPIGYTIYYAYENGEVYDEKTVLYTDVITLPSAAKENRPTHNFNGWTYQLEEGGTVYGVAPNGQVGHMVTVDGGSVTLTEQWSAKTPTVTFDPVGGSCSPSAKTVIYGQTYGTLPTPTRAGYNFAGWFDKNGNTVTDSTVVSDYENHTLTAHWTNVSVTVTFDPAGGSCDTQSKPVLYAEAYGTLPTPTRAGYEFEGWYDQYGSRATFSTPVSDYEPHTLTARWTPVYVEISFDYGDGDGSVSSYPVRYLDTYGSGYGGVLPTPFDRTNYTFNGWYDENENKITASTIVTNYVDHTLTASWTYNPPATDDGGGGDDPCVATGTEILLADGTSKKIEELTGEEMLLVWDFYTGTYVARPIFLLINHGEAEYEIINLRFADGTEIKVVGKHTFYDTDLRMFVCLDLENYRSYVGHSFAKLNGIDRASTELVDAYVTVEHTGSYSIWAAQNINFVTNGILSTTPTDFDNFGIACDENMRYDEELLAADIEKYGLFTYEEWSHYFTYEQFVALNVPYMKIAVGRGLITVEELLALFEEYIGFATAPQ